MSPSIATALNPSWRNARATSLVLFLVEQNTTVWPFLFSLINCKRYPIFSLSFMIKNDWSIPSPDRSSADRRNCFGLFRYSSANLRISGGIVAENRDITLLTGVISRINRISSMNPISSIVSASSNTTYLILSNSIEPCFR